MSTHNIRLPDDTLATITPSSLIPHAYLLLMDGTPQSQVNLDDPGDLFFEYVRRMGHVIDIFRDPGEPITALHLGAGALTLPRYIADTRPGSAQQVIELHGELVDFVREHLPVPRRANIRVRRGDAREKLSSLPRGLHGVVDLVVVDVFTGAQTPAHLTSIEFYQALLPFLAPGAVVLVNTADGADRRFSRRHLATLAQVFGQVAAVADPQVFSGRRFGNIVMIAGVEDAFPLHRLMRAGPHPAKVLEGAAVAKYVAGERVLTDADAVDSPPPPAGMFE